MPQPINDLNGREAVLRAGTYMIDMFRHGIAFADDRGVEHARHLVPPAFVPAMNEHLAINMFAAGIALLARLDGGHEAGCVAEEIMAVELIDQAEAWLDGQKEQGHLSREECEVALRELKGGIFDLFGDDDVLNLSEMSEPSDASLALHDPVNQAMGVADQRVQRWFDGFGGIAPTGHLNERGEHSSGDR